MSVATMNMESGLDHALHNAIDLASCDELEFVLMDKESPLHFEFLQYLAHGLADWMSQHDDADRDKLKQEWASAFNHTSPQGHGITPEDEKFFPEDSHPRKEKVMGMERLRIPQIDYDDDPAGDFDNSHSFTPISPTSSSDTSTFEDTENEKEGEETPQSSQTSQNSDEFKRVASGLKPKLKESDSRVLMKPIFDKKQKTGKRRNSLENLMNWRRRQQRKPKLPLDKRRLFQYESASLSLGGLDDEEKEHLLCEKLEMCCVTFDFKADEALDGHSDLIRARNKKTELLQDVSFYVKTNYWFTPRALQHCFKMICCNIFRALPKKPTIEDEFTEFEEPRWPHLRLVYEFALHVILCADFDKDYLVTCLAETRFGARLLYSGFSSHDHRERECAKTILHRVYGRMMPLRDGIRSDTSAYLLEMIYGDRDEIGVCEILEIYCSIIHGFTTPIKESHLAFLRNVLLPLMKCPRFHEFREQLVACFAQYILKNNNLVPLVMGAMLKFWPKTSPRKEECFLLSLKTIITLSIKCKYDWTQSLDMASCIVHQMLACMQSQHHLVSSRAFETLVHQGLIEFLNQHPETQGNRSLIRRIVDVFIEGRSHWCGDVQQIVTETWDIFCEFFPVDEPDYLDSRAEDDDDQKSIGSINTDCTDISMISSDCVSVVSMMDCDAALDDATKACLGDMVKIKKGKGRVRFIGPIDGKQGTFYGLEMVKPVGKSNGTHNKRSYFVAEKRYGIFTKHHRIIDILSRQEEDFDKRITVGDIVRVSSKDCMGTVRFIGLTNFGSKKTRDVEWYGIELHEGIGRNDGSAKDVQYFDAPDNHGLFVRRDQLTLVRYTRAPSPVRMFGSLVKRGEI